MWRLFHGARERPESERSSWLSSQCAEDPELVEDVLGLLASQPPSGFLETVPESFPPGDDDPLLGARLDNYLLESELGRGGMGTVYLARELGALERPAAVKVVRRGLDTERVIERFRAEQATLARLSHPALAAVYQAGITGDGRPWFAMEYVDGVALTDFCRQHQVSLNGRLGMFAEVCDAVQHIHQKGIVHRDIKPSNILVRREDGAVKLIDFGIARAISGQDTARLTQLGRPIGTPEYMSPEQISDDADLDTRSDVYALGVVLYELLTSRRPFDRVRTRPRQKTPQNRAPVTPSQALRGQQGTSGILADPRWRARLRGDIDWIVLKALAHERERRYPTASALAEDIRRALAHEPVTARPPSALYKFSRLVRRHPAGSLAATLAVLSLCALAGALWVRGHQLQVALERAVVERERAEQIAGFMQETFSAADPHQAANTEITARQLLTQGRERAEVLRADPVVRATLLLTIANSFRRLGLFDASHESATSGLQALAGVDSRAALETRAEILASLATLSRDRSDFSRSGEYARQALDLRTRLFGEDSLPVANSTAALGYALLKAGDFEGAEPLLIEAVEKHLALGPASEEIAPFDQLARLYVDRGRFDDAEALYLQSLERSRLIHGVNHPETATRENNLAALYYRAGKLELAAKHYENARAIQSQLLDPLHPSLLTVMNNLGALYVRMEAWGRAESLLEEALAGRRQVLGEEHMEVAVTTYHLANARRGLGELENAERLYTQAIATMRRAAGTRDRRVGVLLNALARLQFQREQSAAARITAEEALTINSEGWPEGHHATGISHLIVAEIALAADEVERAEAEATIALAILEKRAGAEPDAARARSVLEQALRDKPEAPGPAIR